MSIETLIENGNTVYLDFREGDRLGLLHGVIILGLTTVKRAVWYPNGKYVGDNFNGIFDLKSIPPLEDLPIQKLPVIDAIIEENN